MAYIDPVPYKKNGFSTSQGRRLYRMLETFVKFPAANFHVWDKRPECGYFFTGCHWYGADQNQMAALMSILYRFGDYDEALAGVPKERIREMGIQTLRYACFTHDTGPADCVRVDGRNRLQAGTKWGGNVVTWSGPRARFFQGTQVGAGLVDFALAAWFFWDDLDEETRQMAYNVITDYAERWAEYEPRDGTYYNTQAEENGWTGCGVFVAAVLFRDDPRSGKWWEGALRWMLDSCTTPLDMFDPAVLSDGVSFRSRADHITLHPDFTTENHGFVHPGYLAAPLGDHTVMQTVADLAGLGEIPGIRRNWENIYGVFKHWADANGGAIPVQTQDWWYLNMAGFLAFSAMTASLFDDSEAAYIESMGLDTFEKTQAGHKKGTFVDDNTDQVISRDFQILGDMEPGMASSFLWPLLVHYCRGEGPAPAAPDAFEKAHDVSVNYPNGGTVLNRTRNAVSLVSYRNNCIAAVLPDDKLWTVTVPPCSSFGVLHFADEDAASAFPPNLDRILTAQDIHLYNHAHDFGASLSILRGGRIRQDASVVSLPDGRTVIFQTAEALRDCRIAEFTMGLVGLRNEYYPYLNGPAKGYRDLYIDSAEPVRMVGRYGGEDEIFDYTGVHCAAIDDRISYVISGSASVRYVVHHDYPKWKGIEDFLILNRMEGLVLKQGDSLPPFVMVCLPNTGIAAAQETSRTFLTACGGTAQAAILDDTLVYASSLHEKAGIRADFSAADRIPLFRGITRYKDGVFSWSDTAEIREAGFRRAAAFADTGRPFDAAVLPDGTTLIRYEGEDAYRQIQGNRTDHFDDLRQ